MKKIKLFFAAALSMIAWTGMMAQTDADIAQIDAANAAIGTNNVYRIYTLSNGSTTGTTKYYLKADGYLTDQVEEAKSFAFELAAGGSYVKGKGYRLNKFTNGGDGSNNITNDAKTHIIVGTNDRDDFEGQVFFLNEEGNYAIRSTNANSTGWAASAFWTVTTPIGEATIPNATYTMAGPQYIWLLEKDEPASQQLAACSTVKAWPVYIQSAAGLVKDPSKFYSNAKEPSEGSYEALLDGNYETFFHSAWSVSVEDAHYLQAELSEPTQKFEFYFKKRSQNNNNRPTTIVVSASNDAEGEFTEITTLNEGFPTDASVIDYMSGQVDLGAAYKFVRFTVTATNSGSKFFTFSEFYMFPGNEAAASVSSVYNTFAAKAWNNYTAEDIAQVNAYDMALKAAISTVNVTYELYEADGTTLVSSKTTVQKPYSNIEIPASMTSDSKFYDYTTEGTIGETDCTIKVIRTLKPGFVGALADLSNAKAYTIACDRGSFLTKDDYLASTAHESLTEAAAGQFAIISYEDHYYLYSIADGKFVQNNGALADKPSNGVEDAIVMDPKTVPYFLYHFNKVDAIINTNGNDPYGYVINNYSTPDPGNQYYMVEAADFDPTAAIAGLDAQFHPSYAVIYIVKDAFGNAIFTSDPEPAEQGTVITTLPEKYHRTFYTYDEINVTVETTGGTEAVFTATWNGPFEISENFENAHWYNMTMRSTWYVTSDVKDGDGAYKTQDANIIGLGEDSYQWAFVGDGYNGFQIFNKAEGADKSFGWTDATQTNAGIPTIMDNGEGYHFWKIVASTNTSVPANSFCLNVPSTNLYINQYGGAGGSVKFWNSANNVGDPGSAFTVFDVPTDFSEYVVSDVAPVVEATGYFTYTDAAKAAIGYDPAYKNNCDFATFKGMMTKIKESYNDVNNFVLPETGVYFLTNKYYPNKGLMGMDPSDANMYGDYAAIKDARNYVTLIKTGAATYKISLMGKYAPATVAQSTPVVASTEAGIYTVVITKSGYAAFQADLDVDMSCLHRRAEGDIVGWSADADASMWSVTDAKSINLTVGEAGYATAYLPFPVEIGQTLSVPAAKAAWTFDDGTTGTLTATSGVTIADGVATVPVGDNLAMETGATELGTYTFMMDVKVVNEDKGRYTSLYKASDSSEDGALFIYNHKTNGRRIGINAGGMSYGGSYELDTWYRIVVSCENSMPTVYVNGEKVVAATAASTTHWTLGEIVRFFADNDGEEENEVKADQIRFWDVALTADEVAMLGAYGDPEPVSSSVAAYTAVINQTWLDLVPVEGTIPAYTAVVLKADPAVYEFTIPALPAEETTIPDGALGIYDTEVDGSQALVKEAVLENNVLKGTLEPIDAAGKYVLAKPEGEEVCFYLADKGKIAPCKAYLELDGAADVKAFYFNLGGDPTGIANVEKPVENGLIYNIAGQRLNKMQKGINIVNGKKILK